MHFMQQFRVLQRTVALKLKLNYEEKTFVENNRFPKLQLSDSSSGDDARSRKSHGTVKSKTSGGEPEFQSHH